MCSALCARALLNPGWIREVLELRSPGILIYTCCLVPGDPVPKRNRKSRVLLLWISIGWHLKKCNRIDFAQKQRDPDNILYLPLSFYCSIKSYRKTFCHGRYTLIKWFTIGALCSSFSRLSKQMQNMHMLCDRGNPIGAAILIVNSLPINQSTNRVSSLKSQTSVKSVCD